MDPLVLERLCTEWSEILSDLRFRGARVEPALARLYFGPAKGERGPVHALVIRWPEPLWLWLEETHLPRERDRLDASMRFDGATIASFGPPGFDRRIRIALGDARHPDGFWEIEAWPPGNLLLVGPRNEVRWILHRRNASSVRPALAIGTPYAEPPAQFRADPRTATAAAIEKTLSRATRVEEADQVPAERVARALAHDWCGVPGPFSESVARSLRPAPADTAAPDFSALANRFSTWAEAAYAAHGSVLGLRWTDKHCSASLVSASVEDLPARDLELLGPWGDWATAARGVAAALPEAITSDEISEARQRVRRAERALDRIRRDEENARQAPEFRRKGEALLAYLHQVERRASSARVPDPARPERTLSIALDPRLSPPENAKRYFQRAAKLERAQVALPARRRVLEEELKKAEAVLGALERGERPADAPPPPPRGEITPGRPARTALGPRPGRGEELPAALKPRRYRTREGWEVWIGRSNKGNDYLTHRLARGEDYWFHVQGSPGSHVVLRRGKGKDEPSRETIREVASWAAFYSQQRNSGTVPVVVTRKKYVRKPRGAPPGLASVAREKSVFVKPKEPDESAQITEESALN